MQFILQDGPVVFNWVLVWAKRRPFHDLNIAFDKGFTSFQGYMARRVVLLKNKVARIPKPQMNARNQTIFQYINIFWRVHCSVSYADAAQTTFVEACPHQNLGAESSTSCDVTVADGLSWRSTDIMASPYGHLNICLIGKNYLKF